MENLNNVQPNAKCVVCGGLFYKLRRMVCCSTKCSTIYNLYVIDRSKAITENKKWAEETKAFANSFSCASCGAKWEKHWSLITKTKKHCSRKCGEAARHKRDLADPIKRAKIIAWNRARDRRLTPARRAARYAKKKQNPQFIIAKAHRRRIWEMCSKGMMVKKSSSLDLAGCSAEFLKTYIEQRFASGMSWDNYGEWHIDHVVPLASFDLTNLAEQLKAFHYTNLQPLWAAENFSKSDRVLWQNRLPLSDLA